MEMLKEKVIKPHIMIHINGNQGGGIRSVSEAWYKGFVEKGFRVSYLMNTNGSYTKELLDKNREIYCADVCEIRSVSWNFFGTQLPDVIGWIKSYRSTIRARKNFERIFSKAKPSVIIGDGAASAAVIGSVCKKYNIKLVCCFHNISHPRDLFSIRKHLIAYLVNRNCCKIVGVSKATLSSFSSFIKIPYSVIYNSVPQVLVSSEKKRIFRDFFNIPENNIVFGCASRITADKAIHRFVEAAKIFIKKNPNVSVTFLIAGETKTINDQIYLQEIVRTIEKNNLNNYISFLGYIPIKEFYSIIDVFCHTRRDVEPLGLTIVEALSAGLPVILCNEGGFLEFLPSDIGIRYDKKSKKELAIAMEKMLNDYFRKKQAELGKQFYLNRYISFSQWTDKWLDTLLN
jgi:glycosyltransferase involved in cell wall biosynthesis